MTRVLIVTLLLALPFAVTACGGSDDSAGGPDGRPANITMWTPFVDPELKTLKAVVSDFEAKHPGIHVKVVGGTNDDKIVAAIRGGNAPDVAQSFSSDNMGAFCPSGAWADLGSYLERDGVDESIFPEAPRVLHRVRGHALRPPDAGRHLRPLLQQAAARQGRLQEPAEDHLPADSDGQEADARDASGKLEVVGFNPFPAGTRTSRHTSGRSWGTTWMDGDKSTLNTPAWADHLRWQKSLVDWYGYDNLVRFNAGAGDEFSESNAFETGKVAMHMDGEWRVAFIKREHPELDYATAPFPVADDHPDLYGAGYVTGSIIGIPKTSKHKDQAWLLVKYLGTNAGALAKLSNGIQNVPTTLDSLKSPALAPLPRIPDVPRRIRQRATRPRRRSRASARRNQETFQSFITKYMPAKIDDLEGGLAGVDKQIDAQLRAGRGRTGALR